MINYRTIRAANELLNPQSPYVDPVGRRSLKRFNACAFRNRHSPEKRSSDAKKQNLAVYGLTIGQFKEMVSRQNGECAICHKKEKLHVDHCHETGKIRGLFCNRCNMGLARFDESELTLLHAISYIKRSIQ